MKKIFLFLLFITFIPSVQSQVYNIDDVDGQELYISSNEPLIIYDSGGATGAYGINESYQVTICSGTYLAGCPLPPEINAHFLYLDIEGEPNCDYDKLSIFDSQFDYFDGYCNDHLPPLYGTTSPSVIEDAGGCLTLFFESDNIVNFNGFAVEFSYDDYYYTQELELYCGSSYDEDLGYSIHGCFSCIDEYSCNGVDYEGYYALEHLWHFNDNVSGVVTLNITGNVDFFVKGLTSNVGTNGCPPVSDIACGVYNQTSVTFNADNYPYGIWVVVDANLEESYTISLSCGITYCEDIPDLYCDNLTLDNNDPNYSSLTSSIIDNHDSGLLSDGFYNSNLGSGITFANHERIYQSPSSIDGHLTIDVKPKDANLDVDLFVYQHCIDQDTPPTGVLHNSSSTRESGISLQNCLYRSIEGQNIVDAIFIDNPNTSYYIVVDGQSTNNNNYDTEGEYEIILTCGTLTDHDIDNIECGVTQETTQYEGNHASYYSCDDPELKAGNYGPEKVFLYEHKGGPVSIELEILEHGVDLNLYLLDEPSVKNCINKSKTLKKGYGSKELIDYENLEQGTYYIVIDGYCGDYGLFKITIDCKNDLCDIFQPIYTDDFDGSYVEYTNGDLINQINPTWWKTALGNGIIKTIGKSGKGIELENSNSQLTFLGLLSGSTKMCFDLGMKYNNSNLLPGRINLSPADPFVTFISYYSIEWGHDSNLGGNYARLCKTDNSGTKVCYENPLGQSLWDVLNHHITNSIEYNNFCIIFNSSTLRFSIYINNKLFWEGDNVVHTGYVFENHTCIDNISFGHCTNCISYTLSEVNSSELSPQFINNSTQQASYVVANGPDGYVDTLDLGNNSDLNFHCPFPGYWEYCFWYENDGNWEYCCVPYCAYSPNYECNDINVQYGEYSNSSGSYGITFSCGEPPVYTINTDLYLDGEPEQYWTKDGVRLTDFDGSFTCEIGLPPGQYTICCWHYDYYCGRYTPCCKTICVEPYEPDYPPCLNLDYIIGQNDDPLNVYFNSNDNDPAYFWRIKELNTGDIQPDALGGFNYNFPSFGTYTVCSYYNPNDEIILYDVCCKTICLTNPDICTGNIFVLPYDGNKFLLKNDNNIEAMYWEITGTETSLTIYGDDPLVVLPSYDNYTICMYYLDDCCNVSYCCFEFCYYNPYNCGYIEPYYIGVNGSLKYNFTLEQDAINNGVQAGNWVIDGENTVMGNGNNINYTFSIPGEYDISVNVWDPISYCWKVCCRRICVVDPFACDNVGISYYGTAEHPYKYSMTVDEPNITNISWILHLNGNNIILNGDSPTIDVDLEYYGVGHGDNIGITVRYYNTITKCWKFCCKNICVVDPFACSYLSYNDISTSQQPYKYKFNLNVGSVNNIKWVLHRNGMDIPLTGIEKMIEVNFPNYNVNPGDQVAVTVSWYDPSTKCWKFCCKEISLTPPQDVVVFNISSNCGSVGSTVSIPITVSAFSDISIFGFELTHASNMVKFLGIENVDSRLVGLSNNTTGIFDNKLIIGWEHPQATKITIEDNAVVFHILVKILQDFNSSIEITGTNISVFGDHDLQGIVYSGDICVANVVNIAGNLSSTEGQFSKNVIVTLSGDKSETTLTNNDGNYSFDDLTPGNYQVSAYNNDNIKNGVNIIDVALIRWHYLQKKPINNDYKKIAADVDHDGGIDIIDVGLARRIYLEKISAIPNNTSWRYIPKELNIIANPLDPNMNETINYNPLNQSEIADFISVKVGDVDNSAAALKTHASSVTRVGDLIFSVDDINVVAGKQVSMSIKVSSFNNIAVFGFEMKWDSKFMSLSSVSNIKFDQFNSANYEIKEGRLIVGWDQNSATGVDFIDGVIFDLVFEIAQDAIGASRLEFSEMVSVDGDFIAVNISGSDGDITIVPDAIDDIYHSKIKIYPNPFTEEVHIDIDDTFNNYIEIKIYSATGHLISSYQLKGNNSYNSILLPASKFNGHGVFFIKVSNGEFSILKKVVKI